MSDFAQKKKGFIISTGLIVVILIIELFVRQTLFDASLDLIHNLQNGLPWFVKYFFYTAASLADPNIIIAVYLLILSIQINKFFLVKIGCYVCFIGYSLSIAKTLYASPRPYWVRPIQKGLPGYVDGGGIKPYEAYAEYGNPSGHALFTLALYGYLFYTFTVQHYKNVIVENDLTTPFDKQDRIDDEKNVSIPAEEAAGTHTKQSPPMSKALYRCCFAFFVFCILSVCLSRLYLGMHSMNQVMLGLSFGGYLMYTFINFFDMRLENFLKTIAKQELENRALTIWSFSVCYILCSLLPIALFIQNSSRNVVTDSDTWNKWWVVVHTELNTPPHAFAYIRCFLDSGVIGGLFGILIGCLASNGSFSETSPRLNTIPKIKLLFRVIVFFIVAAIIPGILTIIPIPEQNYIMAYFILYNLRLFSAGFSATKLVPIAYQRLGLEIEGDFLMIRKINAAERSMPTIDP